jgi:Xaa-Pro aminopeptidase
VLTLNLGLKCAGYFNQFGIGNEWVRNVIWVYDKTVISLKRKMIYMTHSEQRQRAQQLLQSKNVHRALFANPHTVAWLTGFAPPPWMGPSPFAGGPPLVYYAEGTFTLIAVSGSECDTVPVVHYLGYTIEAPIAAAQNLATTLQRVLGSSALPLAIEQQHLPAFLLSMLGETRPIDGWLETARMIKTAEELASLRRAFALTDVAHAAARESVHAGVSEMEVWNAAHSAAQRSAGQRLLLGNDCVVSTRQNNIGGLPLAYVLQSGGSMIVDLGTCVEGYWSDSCATYYPDEPTAAQKKLHQYVAEALDFAISLVKPGVAANDIDRRVREFMAKAGHPVYPHHTGHGVGVSPHEEPRIVPYNSTPLEAGMVIMLEPGVYIPGEAAVRLEHALLVTDDGAEILTKHNTKL